MFIGNYRDQTGWAKFAESQIIALDAAGIDVVPRHIKLNQVDGPVHPRILELEGRSARGADACIQNVLPHFMERSGRFARNIAYPLFETSHVRNTTWPTYLGMMGEAWVTCPHNALTLDESYYEGEVQIVPMALDTSVFERSYQPLPIRDQIGDRFLFYTIGEISSRKNLATLLRAFHSEFHPDEPVELCIKTTPTGLGPDPMATIDKLVTEVKRGLKLYSNLDAYKRAIICCQDIPEEGIYRFHKTGDCFVTASLGEAVCIPALQALGFGKAVITPDHSGFRTYMNDEVGWPVPAVTEDYFGTVDAAFGDLYTADEQCGAVTVNSLRKTMRTVYESKELRAKKSWKAVQSVYEFSLQNVGNIMKVALGG